MLWRCRRCGCSFAVGLPHCPQCTGTDVDKDEGDAMPKITKARGATDKRVPEPSDGEPVAALEPDDAERAALVERGEAAGLTGPALESLSDDEVAAVVGAVESGDATVQDDGTVALVETPEPKAKRASGTRKRASGARKSTG